MARALRAIVMNEFGPPSVLVERSVPQPSGEVVIEVEYANVTFVETQIRAGRPPHPAMLPSLPAIPGNGVGGIAGSGRRVVATTGGTGGYAAVAAVAADRVVPVPPALSMSDAVALLADGRTALALIDRAQIRAGETVLVEAAGGGVGSLLVQLAAALGARVAAAAGSPRKLELARSLGAEVAMDYASLGALGGFDVVFDGIGGEIGRRAFELVRPGGRHCAFGMASGTFAPIDDREARERGVMLLRGAAPSVQEMTRLTALALEHGATGRLRPVIGQTFALERAADAHRAIEARATVGKTLLAVGAAQSGHGR
jgi:NADPH2:quinone reductase